MKDHYDVDFVVHVPKSYTKKQAEAFRNRFQDALHNKEMPIEWVDQRSPHLHAEFKRGRFVAQPSASGALEVIDTERKNVAGRLIRSRAAPGTWRFVQFKRASRFSLGRFGKKVSRFFKGIGRSRFTSFNPPHKEVLLHASKIKNPDDLSNQLYLLQVKYPNDQVVFDGDEQAIVRLVAREPRVRPEGGTILLDSL